MSVYQVHTWCPGRSEEGIGTGVTEGCKLGAGEMNSGSLQEQTVLLTAEPFLQSQTTTTVTQESSGGNCQVLDPEESSW